MNKYKYQEHFLQKVRVDRAGFDCFISDGFEKLKDAAASKQLSGRKVLLINEKKFSGFYLDRVSQSLSEICGELTVCELPDENVDYNLAAASVFEKFEAAGMSEADCILSLGSPVSDVTARVFSHRYAPSVLYIKLPVTFLGQILSPYPMSAQTDLDFSGTPSLVVTEKGATADVNTAVSEREPDLVYINCLAYKNLLETDRVSGMGEVLRECISGDAELFSYLEANAGKKADQVFEYLENIVINCLLISRKTKALQPAFGLGEPIARALERCTNYIIPHGQAVCIGMVVAANIAHERGLLSGADHLRMAKLLAIQGLVILMNFTNDLIDAICANLPELSDGFTLPTGIGKTKVFKDVTADEIRKAMNYRR